MAPKKEQHLLPPHEAAVITGNYFNKYQSRNPVVRLLVKRFQDTLGSLVRDLPVRSILEVGSGEGYLLSYLRTIRPDLQLFGSDITLEVVKLGIGEKIGSQWCVACAEELPFSIRTFDLLLACEVLEHLKHPEEALAEFRRLNASYCIISVPEEPLWRILNIARGKYWRYGGNTPGHIQHWSKHTITDLVAGYYNVMEVRITTPWIFILASTIMN